MALDPLRFAIEIVDEATTKLTSIKSLIEGLNNKEITVNVQGNLKEVLDILSKSGADANALGGLQNALSGALTALENLGNAAKNGDFSTFSTEVGKATEAVNGLAGAFEKMNIAVGNNESFKQFMTGVGELVSRTNSAMKQLNSVGGSDAGNDSADKGFLRLSTSIEKAKYELYQFDNLIKSAESASRLGKQFSDIDTNGLDKAIEKAKTFRAELEQISQTGKGRDDRRFDKFALRADYKEAVAEVRRLVGETETLETSQRRYNTILQGTKDLMQRILNAQDSARNIGAQNNLIGKFSEAYDFKQRLQSLSDSDKANAHIISELAAEYTRLAQSLTRAAKEQEKLNAATEKEKKRSDDDRAREIQRVETNQRRLNGAYEEAGRLIARLEATGMKGLSLGLDVTKVDDARNQLVKFQEDLAQFGKMYAHNNHTTQETIGNFNILRRALVETAKAQEQMNTATEKANKEAQRAAQRQQEQAAKQAAEATKRAQQENEAWANSMKTATNEANKLDVKIRELQRTESGAAAGVNTSQLRSYINDLRVYRDILKEIAGGSRTWGKAETIIGNNKPLTGIDTLNNTKRLADEAANAVNRETREIERNQAEKQKAAGSTSQLTAEEQRLAQALNQTTEHARGQSQVLSDLKSMAMQYLGVWGGQQFLHNIIEIGGQLEMQRLSIGAILSNQSQANDLFEKIKGLAVQSPFGVVELDQMTKQLTAYGFKYNELFDMTKRLADISAATGTGVDRLALAIGHVRSEAALSGYTLRQFSMANVPLLAKLSEKLGKTTQEIRKMVRAKEVSYEDVVGVLKDITNEGGMFYQMQEVISSSVKAKFKNVKDAMDIMYGEMAEGYIGDSLKGVAEALMEVTRNWKDAATVLGTGAAMWAAHRVAAMAYATTLGKTNAAVLASIAAHNKQEAAVLSLAGKYRVLTVTEQERLAASKKNVVVDKLRLALGRTTRAELEARDNATKRLYLSDLQLAMSEKKLTVEGLARLVATGKVTKAEALQIITNLELADSERMLAAQTIMGTKHLGMFRMGLLAVGNAAKGVALALKAIMFNPAMLGMAAITGLVELWQRNNAEMERAKELGDAIFEASQEGLKNARTMMQSTGIEAYQFRDGKLANLTNSFGAESENKAKTFLVKPEFDPSTAQQIIDEWSQYIREYSGNPNKMLNDALVDEAGNVRMLKDQFDHLYLSVEQVIKAQKGLADIADIFQMAQESTGEGWLNEDIVEDVKDYDKALRSFNKTIITTFRNNGRAVKSGIDAAREFDANFAKNTEGMSSYGDMLKELVENYEKYGEAVRRFNGADYGNENLIEDIIGQRGEVRGARKEMQNELDQFISGITSAVEAGKIKLDDSTKNGLMAMFEEKFIGSLGNISEEAKKELRKRFADAIGFVIDDAEEITEKRLADWQVRAGKVFEINKEIKVKTKTITDISEFAKAVQEDLKKKQDYIKNNASHINHVLNLKTSLKLDVSSLNDQIIALSSQVQKLVAQGKIEAAKSLNSIIQDELLPYRDAMMAIEENKKWLKSEGYPETEAAKDKPKKEKKTGTKTYKDEVAAEWKERIRLLKDANTLYKEWNKRSGEDAALSRVRQQYGDIFEQWRTDKNLPWKDFKAEDIIEYRKYIQKIVDEAQSRYNSQRNDKAKNYGKEAEAVLREGKKLLDDIDKYDFDEKAREFKTSFEKALDDMTRRWEIFASVRNATGDKMLAFDMAGISQSNRDLRNAADALKRNLADEMQRVGGDELIAKIPFSIDIDEEKLRDQFKAVLGDSEKYATTIDGLVEAYKKWQKLQQDVVKNDIDVFSKLMGAVVSYSAQIQKINDELAQQKTAIANSGASETQQREATQIAESQADWKKMKLSADYSNLYNKTIAMSRTEFENAAEAVQRMIDKLRDLGAISPDEYLQEVDKLNKARMEWSTNGFLGERGAFGNFISGGNQGLMDYYQQRADAARRRADYLKDTEFLPSAAQKKARAEAEHYQKLYDALKKLTDEAQKVITAFQTLQSGIDLLGGLFDSLGMEGAANAMSDAGGILGGALQGASSLSALGPYGMAAGAAIGLIGGIAQVHDKALERHINKLREDVKGIEANTELIVRSRERTLGYDTGDVRRQMAQQYAPQSYGGSGIMAYINAMLNGSKQNKSMFDYYTQNSQGTGYQQEYDNLVEQREKYMEILKDQQDKKKKSNEEIEETKSKIAELDDQIRYFTQDLAKELWGIDIKGWADQLSDALASAFENGENMAKAYKDTVTSIIQQMMQKMMQMAILEPMFERLQKQLFGENGKGGVFDPNNPKGSMSKVTKIIGDYFGKGGEGEKAITASMEFMTAFERAMQNAGLTVLNEASNTLQSSMQGTTEETSGLLAGYVNALRQDVSVNRILLTQYVTQLWPQYVESFTAQVTSVQSIDNNVRIIMEMMQMGNGAMFDEIAAMRTRIDNIVTGIDRVSIR